MKKHLPGSTLAFFVFAMTTAYSGTPRENHDTDSDLVRILERYAVMLVDEHDPAAGKVRESAASLTEGRWTDFDYEDQSPGMWHPYRHLLRVREMTLACADRDHPLGGNSEIRAAILAALDDWIRHRYQADNWWFNEIGAPRLVRDIVVLMKDGIDNARREALLEIIDQHEVRGTGANLVWTAEIALHYACLTGDRSLAREAAERIQDEITVGGREGIQEDWSFFQHGARLQTFHYGRSYLEVVVAVAWQLRETDWALPANKVELISKYILEGMQWMARGRETVPGTMDRMASRPGTLRVDMRPALRSWRDVDPDRADEIDAFIARQDRQEAPPRTGFRHFRMADFTAYHRPAFSFFLKTVSDRTHLTESINQENLLGADLNTGDHYIITDNSSYHNLPPVWDWDRLPGVTRMDERSPIGRRAFAGGVGDGHSGATAMDYRREANGEAMAVRRFWAFHEDWVLALFGGWQIEGNDDSGPYTGIDQRPLRGEVSAGFMDGESNVLEEGTHGLEQVQYLWHDGLAYLFREPVSVQVRIGEATGSWYRINRNRSEEPVSENLFLAKLEHGTHPAGATFAIAPAESPDQAERLLGEPSWQVVRNDEKCQGVRFSDDTGMAAFYEPASLNDASDLGALSVDRPCLVFWSGDEIRAADPTHEGGELRITWGEKEQTVSLPSGGKDVLIEGL